MTRVQKAFSVRAGSKKDQICVALFVSNALAVLKAFRGWLGCRTQRTQLANSKIRLTRGTPTFFKLQLICNCLLVQPRSDLTPGSGK